MKIAQIVCTFPPYQGGMGNSVYNFARSLAALGHEVVVFTTAGGKKSKQQSDDNNIFTPLEILPYQRQSGSLTGFTDQLLNFKVVRLKPLFRYSNAAILPQLFWRLDKFDIVHLHYPFFGAMEIILLLKLFFKPKFKLVMHYHMDAAAAGFKGVIFKLSNALILPILLRQARIISCASLDYVKHSQVARYYSKHEKKFRQTLFGVDLEQFVIFHDHVRDNKTDQTILFVGGLDKAHYFKGLENLLYAVKILKNKIKEPIKLVVIGEGELKEFYQILAAKLKIDKIIDWPEQIDISDLVKYYNYSDIFVLPSINQTEAFGLVLLEAMACAKPVIASNLPGVRSVFKNGAQGLLAKPGDIKDLAAKIKILLLDYSKAKQMGLAGRKLVEAKYTWEKVAKRLDLLYHYAKYTPDR